MKKSAFITNFMGFYNILWAAVLPFLRHHPRLRHSFDQRMDAGSLEPADIWIQAASAGEALLAVRLVRRLSSAGPVRILVTTTTDQGMDILREELKKKCPASLISVSLGWFPFDSPAVAAKAVKSVKPRVMVLLETELWPSLLYSLRQHHTRILVVNGRMSSTSSRNYRMTKPVWSRISPHVILAISDMDALRFRQVFDRARVTVMPNMKFETLTSHPTETVSSFLTDIFPCTLPVSVFASIRRQEEPCVFKMIHTLFDRHPGQVIALFPRHMHRVEAWKRRLKKAGLTVYLRSKLSASPALPGIILWDRFGEMRQIFGYADTVFMGGSLKPLGGQNFLEPLLQGAPVVTGPFWDDFFWVGEQIFDTGLVQRMRDWRSAAEAMAAHLKHPQDPHLRRQKARNYVLSRSGGTDKACRAIRAALSGD